MADQNFLLAPQSLDPRLPNSPLLERNQDQFIGLPDWGAKILFIFGPGSPSLLVMS